MSEISELQEKVKEHESQIVYLNAKIIDLMNADTSLNVSEKYDIWVSSHNEDELTKCFESDVCYELDEIGIWDRCELNRGQTYNFIDEIEGNFTNMEHIGKYNKKLFKHITKEHDGNYDKFVDYWKLYAMENDHNAFRFDW